MTTEREFQVQITEVAVILGYSWVHFRPARTAHGWRTPVEGPLGEGWPDLQLVHPRAQRTIYAEIKGDGGTLEAVQRNTLAFLASAGLEVYVWWPRDFDAAAAVLQGRGDHGRVA